MIETVRLEPRYHGYGIRLLAVDGLLKRIAQALPRWSYERLVVLTLQA
jgi:hypothetical protein